MIVTFTNTSNSSVSLDISDTDVTELKKLIKLQFISYLEHAQIRGLGSYSSPEVDQKVVSWFEKFDVNYLDKDDRITFINQIMPEIKFGQVSVSTENPLSSSSELNDSE
jgi:hypothetical protein